MPTGNVSLLEANKSGSNMKKAGVTQTIIRNSGIIEALNWKPFEGVALKHEEEGTLPNVQFRRVNETYTSSWGSDNEHFWGVAILGGEITVDKFLVNVVGSEEDIEAKQWRKLAKANAMRFDYEFFNGTGSTASKGFKGVKQLISEGFGQSVANSTTGAVLSLEKLDEAIESFRNTGGPSVALSNRNARRQLTHVARSTYSGYSLIDVGTDSYGRKVTMYDGIPFTATEDVIDGSGNVVPALPFTEDPGDGTSDTCSIYLAKMDEDNVTGLLGKGGSFDVQSFGELESAPQRMGRLEWYPGIAIFNKYSITRLTGITEL